MLPSPEEILKAKDILVVIGDSDALKNVRGVYDIVT
jgi:K+/H+ antiporter YhaU regulatory subunit KhtT